MIGPVCSDIISLPDFLSIRVKPLFSAFKTFNDGACKSSCERSEYNVSLPHTPHPVSSNIAGDVASQKSLIIVFRKSSESGGGGNGGGFSCFIIFCCVYKCVSCIASYLICFNFLRRFSFDLTECD